MKTKSEQLFENFLTANGVQSEKIKEDTSWLPDTRGKAFKNRVMRTD